MRQVMMSVVGACVVMGAVMGGGCSSAPTRTVTRVDPNTQIDLDYRFNDSDATQVYQGMVGDATYRPWIDRFKAEHGHAPVLIVGPIDNHTQTYIDNELFTGRIENELINSGLVRVVANAQQRLSMRGERQQGLDWNSPETRKQMRNELGADVMLIGTITDDQQRTLSGSTGYVYYLVNLQIVNLETNEKLWGHPVSIKKVYQDR